MKKEGLYISGHLVDPASIALRVEGRDRWVVGDLFRHALPTLAALGPVALVGLGQQRIEGLRGPVHRGRIGTHLKDSDIGNTFLFEGEWGLRRSR